MAQPPFIGERISILSPSESGQCERSFAGTTSPFSPVASQLPSYSSSFSSAARVAAETSRVSPLTMSFIEQLPCRSSSEDHVSGLLRDGGGQQESVAE